MEKNNKFKTAGVIAIIVSIIGLTIAFAALSRNLTINGSAKQDASTSSTFA